MLSGGVRFCARQSTEPVQLWVSSKVSPGAHEKLAGAIWNQMQQHDRAEVFARGQMQSALALQSLAHASSRGNWVVHFTVDWDSLGDAPEGNKALRFAAKRGPSWVAFRAQLGRMNVLRSAPTTTPVKLAVAMRVEEPAGKEKEATTHATEPRNETERKCIRTPQPNDQPTNQTK